MPDSDSAKSLPRSPLQIDIYVDAAAAAIDLPIPAETRQGVIENFERICDIAGPVVEFPLPDNLEAAPVFKP